MQVYYQLLPKYRCNNFAFVSTFKPVQACYSSDRYSKKVNEVPPKKYRVSPGYELFLPEGILTYFEVTHADRTATAILIYLDEKDLSEEERSGKHLQSKGFYPPASIHDFPLRGKSLILHVRRRRWVDLDTGNPYMRAWEVVAKGTRLTEEFASFLKGTLG